MGQLVWLNVSVFIFRYISDNFFIWKTDISFSAFTCFVWSSTALSGFPVVLNGEPHDCVLYVNVGSHSRGGLSWWADRKTGWAEILFLTIIFIFSQKGKWVNNKRGMLKCVCMYVCVVQSRLFNNVLCTVPVPGVASVCSSHPEKLGRSNQSL